MQNLSTAAPRRARARRNLLAGGLLILGLPGASLMLGCASPQAVDISACQQDKEALLATIRQQRDELQMLRERTASLESRLAESEIEIARLDPTRQARGPVKSRQSDGLSWRSPADKTQEDSDATTRR